MANNKIVRYNASNPHYGKIEALKEMPFIDLVDSEGNILCQLYLFRFRELQVSHNRSDSTNQAGATWSSIWFDDRTREALKNGDYNSALCVMRLLIEKALHNQSHRDYYNPDAKDEDNRYLEMVYRAMSQDQEVLDKFAMMCVDSYRAHH